MILSIVIVNWNIRDMLAQCLESVYAHPPQDQFEVLVIDNASTDGSAAMLRVRFPQARLIENRENVGFARGNNQAIQQTTGDYVLLLNPDTQVRPGALQTLVDFMQEHPEAGAAGAYILNPDGSLQTSCYPVPTLSRELWRLFHLDALHAYGVYHMNDWDVKSPRQVEALLGACLMVRRSILDQTGLLDEDYFIYTEEIDLCYRIRQAGWSIFWVPCAQVVHYGGQSTRQVATDMFLRLYQSKILYFRKHHGPLAVLLYKLILLASGLFRVLISPFAFLESAPRRQEHLKLAQRYWRLIAALPGL